MAARRVLVTGASGFIGRQALGPLRERGFEIHALAGRAQPARITSPAQPEVIWHHGDLLQPGTAETLCARLQPAYLLHLAWFAEPGKFWTSPLNLDWVRASTELAQAFARHGGRRFVAAGTCAEYDWAQGWCYETATPLRPRTFYGQCKHALQRLLEAHAAQSGLGFAWGRVFHLYGPEEHPARLVASVIRDLLRGQPAECTAGEGLRDFMHVADVAAAFAALLDTDVRGAVNVASGEGRRIRDVAAAIARQMDAAGLLRLGARPTPAGEPAILLADTTRLRSEVGFRPRYTLDAGLADTIAWWRQQRDAGSGAGPRQPA